MTVTVTLRVFICVSGTNIFWNKTDITWRFVPTFLVCYLFLFVFFLSRLTFDVSQPSEREDHGASETYVCVYEVVYYMCTRERRGLLCLF